MLTAALINPVAFHIGPFPVRWYGMIFVTGVLAAIWAAMRLARRRGLDPEFIPDIGMVLVPSGILGARLYEVFILEWSYYRHHPGQIFAIWEGGLAIHGGVILAFICGWLYARYRRQPIWLWADMIAPGLVLAQGIGRWGNFFNQEAFGSPAPQWVINLLPGFIREGMTIHGTVMHPTFLYESAWCVISFGLLYAFVKRKPPVGTGFGLYLILYNIGRFIIESIREDSSYLFGQFRIAQLMAVLQIVLGVGLILWHMKREKRAPAAE